MAELSLFYATNRNHLTDPDDPKSNQWHPKGYGTRFSNHGRDNLRFGKLTVKVSAGKIKKYLEESSLNSVGDGEKLGEYLSECAKDADIHAFKENIGEDSGEEKFGSTDFFNSVKELMDDSQDVVVFIHGYSVSWHQAVGSALSLQEMFNLPTVGYNDKKSAKKVNVILFSWPSDGKKIPFKSYRSDQDDARDSGPSIGRAILKLRDFLGLIPKDKICGRDIHLVCHSMGNFVLQNALDFMKNYVTEKSLPRVFKNIFMCAPDVDEDVLEEGHDMARVVELTRFLTVYYNRGDIAMYLSDYTKGNHDRLGHDGSANPRKLHHKINQVDCSDVVKGLVEHSYYMNGNANLDIRQSIHDLAIDDKRRPRKSTPVNNNWILT